MTDAPPVDPLTPEQLAAVSELWARAGRELRVRFTGTSMTPAITSGAEVRLQCGAGGRPGEVVALRTPDGVLVHRVVAAGPSWILTRGDARVLPDRPAGAAAVIGRVTAVRAGEAFREVPLHADTRAQRAALVPLLALLRASPAAGTAAIAAVVAARRAALLAVGAWRRRAG